MPNQLSVVKWIFLSCGLLATSSIAWGVPQLPGAPAPDVEDQPSEREVEPAEKIEVAPTATDAEIASRLERIFAATGWYSDSEVTTDEGVVFLSGVADSEEHRQQAETIALRTTDVVAVVNQMTIRPRSVWEIAPAIEQLEELGRDFIQLLPLLVVGILVVMLTYGLARLSAMLSRQFAERRIESQLLQQVLANAIAVLVMLTGLYIALKVSGLTRLAVTVLGGTGLVGLALGFAFRDIAENYLASILISLNRPFSVGDLIELEGHKGFVRRVTTRGTLLLTIEGNHIQIPNNTVYKSVVTNYSSSPRIRKDFMIGIGYEDSVTGAQEIVLNTLENHESVLKDPPPLVLVDSLGAATVNLKIFYWLDGKRFDAASVSSALMRRAKSALFEAGISMPDEAREVIFPAGVPIEWVGDEARQRIDAPRVPPASGVPPTTSVSPTAETAKRERKVAELDKAESIDAEGGLENTSEKIQQHALDAERGGAENLIG